MKSRSRRTYAAPKQEGFDFGPWHQYRAERGEFGASNCDPKEQARRDQEQRQRARREQEQRDQEQRDRQQRARYNRPAGFDPREVLGVGPYATQTEIRAAWLKLVKLHHPDHGGDAEKFRVVQAAFERLRCSRAA